MLNKNSLMKETVAVLVSAVLISCSCAKSSYLGTHLIEEYHESMNLPMKATLNFSYTGDSDKLIVQHEEAKYGQGKVLNVEGKLVHVTSSQNKNDHTGCDAEILGTNGGSIPSEPWIALIKRGRCNFDDKVRHAYQKNAIGVIVYNDRHSKYLDKMKIIGRDRNITAVFTYLWIGERFADFLDNKGIDVNVSVNKIDQ